MIGDHDQHIARYHTSRMPQLGFWSWLLMANDNDLGKMADEWWLFIVGDDDGWSWLMMANSDWLMIVVENSA